MKKRSKIEIVFEILTLLKNSKQRKTYIVYGARLNFTRAEHILNILKKHGLITYNGNEYALTEKGEKVLSAIENLNAVLPPELRIKGPP